MKNSIKEVKKEKTETQKPQQLTAQQIMSRLPPQVQEEILHLRFQLADLQKQVDSTITLLSIVVVQLIDENVKLKSKSEEKKQ